jgi:PKD repeat protein
MADILQIYQYQTVDFTDTSTGALPLTRVWGFPGGNPTSSIIDTPNIKYSVPGTYSVTLTETDNFGTTKSLTEVNIIQVSPSSLTAEISGPFPASVKMDEGYQLNDASTGTPFAPTSWAWSLPYGRSSSTQNVGVTGYTDWNTLTGTYSGAPGSTYTGNISLTASVTISGTTLNSTSSTTVNVSKLGPGETLYLNATGPDSTVYSTGLSGGVLEYPGPVPVIANDFGYPTNNNFIIKLDFSIRGSSNFSNVYFHSTNEVSTLTMVTGLWSPSFIDVIGGFIIIQGPIYSQFSGLSPSLGINLGNYIVTNESPFIFMVDETGLLLDLYTNYNYSLSLLSYLLVNPYKKIFSGNIQNINQSGFPGTPMSFIDTGGGSNSNPVVYSKAALLALGAPIGSIYTVYIDVIGSFPPVSISVPFGTPGPFGQTGNDLVTGNYYVAQDNSNGLGFVTILNNAIAASSLPGGLSDLEFKANPIFSVLNGSGYDPSNFNGVSLEIKSTQITSIAITDNSTLLSSPGVTVAPFLGNYFNPQGSTGTCTGMFPGDPFGNINVPPYFNQIDFGGSIY